MPTFVHHFIVRYSFEMLRAFTRAGNLGEVVFAPLPVHLWTGKYREPDIVFLSAARAARTTKHPEGADLAIEVVSDGPENRKRDLEVKREVYARAGISEHWILDPEERCILVLTLGGNAYREHGKLGARGTATSVLLAGFAVSVDAVLAAGQGGSGA